MLDSRDTRMETNVHRIGYALLTLIAMPLFAADVYRSVDENGQVVYSDRPEGNDTERVTIVTARPIVAARPATRAAPAVDAAASREITTETEPERRRVEPSASERDERCSEARARVERYNVSHRLYRTGPDGEREYLNDAEIDEARARAAADVGNWCD